VIEAVAEQSSASASVVKLNVDENPVSAANYGIKGIPTMILFNGGKEVERIVGLAGKESIWRLIEKHARWMYRETSSVTFMRARIQTIREQRTAMSKLSGLWHPRRDRQGGSFSRFRRQ